MKVKAAIALEKAKPLIIDYIDLEGPKKGEVLVGAQAFADYIEKDYQESVVKNGQEWGWTINYAFAVKPTNSERGEYVNARFTGSSGVYEEWYQIKDGKLISWHQTKRSLTQTPTAE